MNVLNAIKEASQGNIDMDDVFLSYDDTLKRVRVEVRKQYPYVGYGEMYSAWDYISFEGFSNEALSKKIKLLAENVKQNIRDTCGNK